MGTGIFYNGTTGKRGGARKVACADAILVINTVALSNMRYSHGMRVTEIELWQIRCDWQVAAKWVLLALKSELWQSLRVALRLGAGFCSH